MTLLYFTKASENFIWKHLKKFVTAIYCFFLWKYCFWQIKMLCSNHRPISILSIFSKIIEKLVHKRLTLFLIRYNILYKHQNGFQRGKLIDHAIRDLQTNIIRAAENSKVMFHFPRISKTFQQGQSWNSSQKINKLWHLWIATKLV